MSPFTRTYPYVQLHCLDLPVHRSLQIMTKTAHVTHYMLQLLTHLSFDLIMVNLTKKKIIIILRKGHMIHLTRFTVQ